MIYCGRIHLIIFCVRTHKFDVNGTKLVIDPHDEPIIISFYPENDPITSNDTGAGIHGNDIMKRSPYHL